MTQAEADRADYLNEQPMVVRVGGIDSTWRLSHGFDVGVIQECVPSCPRPDIPIGMPDDPIYNKWSAYYRLFTDFPAATVVSGEPAWVDEVILDDGDLL